MIRDGESVIQILVRYCEAFFRLHGFTSRNGPISLIARYKAEPEMRGVFDAALEKLMYSGSEPHSQEFDKEAASIEAQEEHERAKACETIVRKARFRERLTLSEIAVSPAEGLTRQILQDICGTGWNRKSVNLFTKEAAALARPRSRAQSATTRPRWGSRCSTTRRTTCSPRSSASPTTPPRAGRS